MMPDEEHENKIRDEEQYEELRDNGTSKEKAASISNAANSGRQGGRHNKYERWSRDDLYDEARDKGIEGCSDMNREELVTALINH